MLPNDAPPVFGLGTHRSRIEHKLAEASYFYNQLVTRDARYRKLTKQKIWKRASEELTEWMYCASAFISATRSTYYYLSMATKANSPDKDWLRQQEQLPVHEVGKQLRDFMLHEATPNTGYQVALPRQKDVESKGEWIARGLLLEPNNPTIAIDFSEVLPQLTNSAAQLAKKYTGDATAFFGAILAGVDALVRDADRRKILSEDPIGPGVSTKRLR